MLGYECVCQFSGLFFFACVFGGVYKLLGKSLRFLLCRRGRFVVEGDDFVGLLGRVFVVQVVYFVPVGAGVLFVVPFLFKVIFPLY